MLKTFKWIACVCGVVYLSAVSVASAAEPLVRTTFTTLGWADSIFGLHYMNGNEEVSLRVPNGAPSASYDCIADQPLSFYRKGSVGADGEAEKILIASTVISSTQPDPLLLFFKGKSPGDGYRVVPIHLGFSNSTEDVYRVFNLSKSPLVAKFQDQKVSLDPGKNITIDSPDTDGPNFGVMIALQAGGGGSDEWKLVYKTFWPYQSGRSGIVFITDREGRPNKIDVRRYYVVTNVPDEIE